MTLGFAYPILIIVGFFALGFVYCQQKFMLAKVYRKPRVIDPSFNKQLFSMAELLIPLLYSFFAARLLGYELMFANFNYYFYNEKGELEYGLREKLKPIADLPFALVIVLLLIPRFFNMCSCLGKKSEKMKRFQFSLEPKLKKVRDYIDETNTDTFFDCLTKKERNWLL